MSTIYTIGYEGTDIDRFIATLKAVDVLVLADVRAVALSRKKGFSKLALRTRLEAEGIDYIHFINLGDPKPGRDAARAGQLDKFRQIYGLHLAGTEAQLAFGELAKVVKFKPTCLLCFERDPNACHRSIVAKKLALLGMEILNLYGDLPRRYDNFAQTRSRRYLGEGTAAA